MAGLIATVAGSIPNLESQTPDANIVVDQSVSTNTARGEYAPKFLTI
ncbi:hypothetical protein FPS14_contig00082-0001 [Flavobacterium psychrophilum]|nr:hypothetical protein FPS14_contig00082-0001 [Flavobacterium psychrophilum]